jgi:hypothetical protein
MQLLVAVRAVAPLLQPPVDRILEGGKGLA